MPGFKAHISTSATLGLAYGTLGYTHGMPLSTCALGAGLCTLGGMLPDMDGDTGVPVRETIPLIAAVVPALLLSGFQEAGMGREWIALTTAGIYLFIRFGVGGLFKKFTVHRGMWHSIPAAINVGLITLLICCCQDMGPRLFKSIAIVIGFMSHLILDEIWSFDILRFRFKRSAGTALKFWTTHHWWPNVMTFGLTLLIFAAATRDHGLRETYYAWRDGEVIVPHRAHQEPTNEEAPTADLIPTSGDSAEPE